MAFATIPAGDAAIAHGVENNGSPVATVEAAVQPVPAVEIPNLTAAALSIEPHSVADAGSKASVLDDELVCLAKVVFHESANQPIKGQLAVAQVVMNRVSSPKFPKTICNVVMQPGQFFNVHAYEPPKDKRWTVALDVARDARAGISEPVMGKALFFRAAQIYPKFFQGRPLVGRIGNHYFHQ